MNQTETMSPHKAEACAQLSPVGQRVFKYVEFDDSEQLLAEIRKHPIGLFFIWLTGLFIAFIIMAATSAVAMGLNKSSFGTIDNSGLWRSLIIVLGLILSITTIAVTALTAFIYISSVVFVTDQKIAEVLYISIFNRKVTQLGMGSVEDVTVLQKGILARLFNFGTLVVETAGEIENCTFSYVPRPNQNSQLIIQAHEENVHHYGN